ncbi:hypothetical protein DPMN_100111 [Dreissena polymorpha]|uniref:Uncharacterized protein n=1 Tax=Dreissena polymorpha TaxID=45954 RepID=A0A9D4LHL4_DREPO|nr:hypothetical protein DPMN_100111 [Dreissena polymorpha]
MLKFRQTNQPIDQPTNQQTSRQGKNKMSTTTIFANLRGCSITRKTAPHPPGGHFHDDWAKNVTSSVHKLFLLYKYKKTAPPPPGSHVIQLTGTIFKLNSRIKETNVLTKFHENWAKNVTSRVEKCPTHWRPCFSPIWTIFELVQDINKTMKTAPPTGGHVFQRTRTTFELNQHIIETNILTNFELYPDIIGTKLLNKFHEDRKRNKTARPPGNHVFQRTRTIFELNSHIKETNKNAPPTGGHVFSLIWTIFELVRDINKTRDLYNRKTAHSLAAIFERLTKFHEDWTIHVASRVFTNKCGRTDDGQRPVTKSNLSNQSIVVCQYESNLILNKEVMAI